MITQEHKELLLQDICSRLLYGVKCKYYDCCEGDYDEGTICGFERQEYIQIDGVCIHIEEVKPYLFPLSSITEEQIEELRKRYVVSIVGDSITIARHSIGYWDNDIECDTNDYIWLINWLYKNHFDVNGLIPLGLANDATGLNIY